MFFNVGGDLRGLQGNALIVEMHVVAVKFGMSPHGRVQIVLGNSLRLHKFQRDGVARGDALVRGLRLIIGGQVRRHFQAAWCSPKSTLHSGAYFWMTLRNFGKALFVFLFAMLPAVHSVVKMDDVEFVLAKNHFNLFEQNRIGDES